MSGQKKKEFVYSKKCLQKGVYSLWWPHENILETSRSGTENKIG